MKCLLCTRNGATWFPWVMRAEGWGVWAPGKRQRGLADWEQAVWILKMHILSHSDLVWGALYEALMYQWSLFLYLCLWQACAHMHTQVTNITFGIQLLVTIFLERPLSLLMALSLLLRRSLYKPAPFSTSEPVPPSLFLQKTRRGGDLLTTPFSPSAYWVPAPLRLTA